MSPQPNVIIGIDPDIKGGIAFYHMETEEIRLHEMPTTASHFGCKIKERSRRIVDCERLYWILEEDTLYFKNAIIHMEKIHAIKGNGIVSTFTFGRTVGMIAAVVMAQFGCNSIREIHPQAWKRQQGLIGSPKDASRLLAIEKFPHLRNQLRRKRDVGKADALWIALAR